MYLLDQYGTDIACANFCDIFATISVHSNQAANTFTLALGRVVSTFAPD
jgi:hypothetical protein